MRKLGVFSVATALAAATLGVLTSHSATATTPPVAITADDLSTWQTNGIVWAFAQADGVVFAGGTFSAIRPPGSAAGVNEQPAVNFAAFDTTTGAPTGCHLSFTGGTGTVRALTVSPDHKTLYAGGSFGSVNGVGVSNLAAIDIATCTPRNDFHVAVTATVRALTATSDTVYLGGDFQSVAGQTRGHLAAITTTGALKPWTVNTDETARAVEVAADGTHVIVGGDFYTVNGANSHALAVVDATTGAVTKNYPNGFFDNTSVVKDIVTDSTGFYVANEGTGGGVFDGRTAFNYTDWNQRWRDTCLGATQNLALYQSVLYSGSHAHDCSTMGEYPDGNRHHLLAESVDSPALLPWFPDTNDGLGELVGPRVLIVASGGGKDYLWAGGGFTTTNLKAQQGLTRFSNGPDTGAPSVPQVVASSVEPGKVQVRWQSSLDLDDNNLTYNVYRNNGATPVYTVSASSLPWVRPQLTFTDTDVVAGTSYTYRVSASDGTNVSAKSANATTVAAATAETYPARVIADGAGLYWRYDETAGYLADASGNQVAGDNVGYSTRRVVPAAVKGGSTAVTYNGTSQYSYSDRSYPRPTSYSVETWFKTTTTKGGKLVGFGSNTDGRLSASYDKHIYMTNSGQLVFGIYNAGQRTIASGAGLNNGQWHHVVGTQGSNGLRLYVDGNLVASNAAYTTSQDYTGYWHVGGDQLYGWPSLPASNYFAGSIDETAIYPSVLTPAQIAQHHTLGLTG
ncbi:LamG-like jellyroll fold domain-containing protein [Streptomyces fildesensis]|uniref:LamG-like jellyroll fold domain-containing protein n=1 Tax=Streptomyces fildesensis TaxID=375757 RepID=A0ABW8CH11_9ACTN